MNSNRFIKTYERMDGPLNNYTQIKEVKELPSLEYTGEVYFSGSLADFVMSFLEITENPVDVQKFGEAVFNAPQVFFVPTRNELPAEGIDGCGYIIVDEKLLYVYSAEQKQYQNANEEFAEYGFVISTDKSIVGTMDIETELGWDNGTIGIYLIVSEPEDVSTSTIYKKEILEEGTPINTNYIFGENLGTFDGKESFVTSLIEIFNRHKDENPKWQDEDAGIALDFAVYIINSNVVDEGKTQLKLFYDSSISKYSFTSLFNNDSEITTKTFNTIEEVSNFILNDESFTKLMGLNTSEVRTQINNYDLNPIYTDKLDESLDLTKIPFYVVMGPNEEKVHTGVYQYYIYNGKEYIELGGKSGGATENIVKEITLTTGGINNAIEEMNKITFTKEEVIKLSTTSNLVILTNFNLGEDKAQVVNYFYNKEVMSGTTGVIIILRDLYWLIFEEATLSLLIQPDSQNKDIYKFNASIITNINIDRTSIQVSDWEADTTYSAYGYNYKATVLSDGPLYLDEGQVNVIFGMEEAVSGNFAPYVTVEKSQFTIYAKEKPTKEITFDYEVISR